MWHPKHDRLVGKMVTIDQEVEDMDQEGEETLVQMYHQENGEEVNGYQTQDLEEEATEEGEAVHSRCETTNAMTLQGSFYARNGDRLKGTFRLPGNKYGARGLRSWTKERDAE